MPRTKTRAPIRLAPEKGRTFDMGPLKAVFKADGDETRQQYCISEWFLDSYTKGPPPHEHDDDDVFYVIEGTMSFFVGGTWTDAPRGSLVIAPGGTPHSFENRTNKRAGMLNFKAEAGFELDMPPIADWFRARSAEDSRTANAPRRKPARVKRARPARARR